MPGKKKKKVTKKKEKADPLEEKANSIVGTKDLHEIYIRKINKWMLENFGRAIDIFRKFDINSDGVLTYDEFFAGMKDLNAPFSNLDLLVLAKTIDKDANKLIDYIEFSNGVKYAHPIKFVVDDGLPAINIIRKQYESCVNCMIKRWNYSMNTNPRYVLLRVKHDVIANVESYPGHFHALLHAHTSIEGVCNAIKEIQNFSLSRIKVYAKHKGDTKILDQNKTLEDYGYHGDTKEEPEEVTLYYDYELVNTDCPILKCDHYFLRNKSN